MRPLWFEYPTDVRASLVDTQYLVGRDIMVAPILEEGATKRTVYFPKGDAWIDWHTGKRYAGGEFSAIDAPINRLPIFLRVGATAVTQPTAAHVGETAGAPVTLIVASGGSGESVNVEDSGEGFQFEAGDWRKFSMRQTPNNEIFISRSSGASSLSFKARPIAAIELLGVERSPNLVSVNGNPPKRIEYDSSAKRLRIECEPTTEAITLACRP